MKRRLAELFSDDIHLPAEAGEIAISGLTADSRAVRPGMLFAALPGTKVDGALFAAHAVESGAVAVLAEAAADLDHLDVPIIRVNNPRRELAIAAARYFGRQPENVVAVTGTSGKTSVTVFTRQIWEAAGFRGASLGTIGLVGPDGQTKSGLTTPDPVSLHQNLAELASEGVTHLALEASSHGLDQHRLDGVHFSAAAFTNLSRDHLDYHASLEDYLAAKLRLFNELIGDDGIIVFDADEPVSAEVARIARSRELPVISIGRNGDGLNVRSLTRVADGVRMIVHAEGEDHYVPLPLVGAFQVSNALVAAGLAMATGVPAASALSALAGLKGAPGRLERVGTHPCGAPVFVDYSHKPAALATALQALRSHTESRLVVVFGAGGDRDAGKRPLMGEAAFLNADRIIVTDDNPRSEDPEDIRRAILSTAPGAEEIGDRREAIRTAIAGLAPGDVLLIAGKGHETGQIVGDTVIPFSDQDEARRALAEAEDANG
jgi:UDP-N-acetylmuramoyl-L-alanyl-D-glutamate--2,6-diaminopimelate ligase